MHEDEGIEKSPIKGFELVEKNFETTSKGSIHDIVFETENYILRRKDSEYLYTVSRAYPLFRDRMSSVSTSLTKL